MRTFLRSRALLVASAAWGGVIVGHLGGYLAAFPTGPERAAHLHASGHGSFGMLAAAAAVAGLVALLCTGLRSRSSGRSPRVWTAALALAAVQVPGFLVLEVAERHFSLGAALADPAVVLGLAVQVIVACGVALLLHGVGTVSVHLGRRPARPRSGESAPAAPRPVERLDAPLLAFLAGAPRRAPPLAPAA